MPYRYPPEFRRKVLDLLAAGRSVVAGEGPSGEHRFSRLHEHGAEDTANGSQNLRNTAPPAAP